MAIVAIEGIQTGTGIPVGTEVEVRRRFDQAWARGFAVSDRTPGGDHLPRLADGAILPVAFPEDDLRIALS